MSLSVNFDSYSNYLYLNIKFITVVSLLVANCIIANAAPAWDRIVIDLSNNDISTNSNSAVGISDDFSRAVKLTVEPDCIKTVNGDSQKVLNQLYEQKCALITYDGGILIKEYKFNCCGESMWARINNKDWFDLKSQGKVDGRRFQLTSSDGNSRSITFHKVVDKQTSSISAEEFLP